jgi:large subunit ribosomal protein L29
MKAKEMREKTIEELEHLLAGWQEEMFRLKVQAMTGQQEKSNQTGNIRKNVARALTILGEKTGTGKAPRSLPAN